jgi:serine/threonine protein kinase
MGGVCRATDTGMDREWAIKILPDTAAQHPDRLVRFEREAKVLASLNHPNVAVLLRPAWYPDFIARYGLISRIGRKCWFARRSDPNGAHSNSASWNVVLYECSSCARLTAHPPDGDRGPDLIRLGLGRVERRPVRSLVTGAEVRRSWPASRETSAVSG